PAPSPALPRYAREGDWGLEFECHAQPRALRDRDAIAHHRLKAPATHGIDRRTVERSPRARSAHDQVFGKPLRRDREFEIDVTFDPRKQRLTRILRRGLARARP